MREWQLEDAQGGQDEEARQAIALLKQKTEELASAQQANAKSKGPPTTQPPSDIEIASTLDRYVNHPKFSTSACAYPRALVEVD